MKIAITGAAGFIGSNLSHFLRDKSEELILIDNLENGYLENLQDVNQQKQLIKEDVRNPEIESLIKDVDTIIHLAAISSLPECQSNPQKAFDVNVNGTINLLEISRKNKIKKFIFASTSAVYENSFGSPFSEDCDISPDLTYSLSKATCEKIINSYTRNYNLNSLILRFFNVYGPNQDFRRPNPPFTSYLINCAIKGEKPKIFNKNNIRRDYIYIDDVIRIIDRILQKNTFYNSEIYNLCSNFSYYPLEILNIIEKIMHKNIDYEIGDEVNFWDKYGNLNKGLKLKIERINKEINKESLGNGKKLKDFVNYKNYIPMEEGLKKIIEKQF